MPQVNIDNLTRLAQERHDESAWRALWGAVFALPAWFAVSDTQRPDAPMVLALRQQPTLALFTDEALFIRPTMPDVEIRTRAEILAAFSKRPAITVQHQINNCLIDVHSPTDAAGICVLSFLMAPGKDEPLPRVGGPIHFGEFRDRFVLTSEGWKFAERRGRMVLSTK